MAKVELSSREKPADVYATARKCRTAFRRGFQYQQLSFSIALATMEIEMAKIETTQIRRTIRRQQLREMVPMADSTI
ncbi:hypothetical protein [Roseomonas mucosa]|uniref:hypothetical protein n=1 Tax=Roseomonas mucosa TaxID=207340 RepID=UPI00126008F5|nr:hypothetical protein [Roseomonas mucosa]